MRRAFIDIDSEILGQAVLGLPACGLKIVGSANSDPMSAYPVVSLMIEGEMLPVECDVRPQLVDVLFEVEQQGDQRIVRVKSVEVIRPLAFLVAA